MSMTMAFPLSIEVTHCHVIVDGVGGGNGIVRGNGIDHANSNAEPAVKFNAIGHANAKVTTGLNR